MFLNGRVRIGVRPEFGSGWVSFVPDLVKERGRNFVEDVILVYLVCD